MEMAPSVPLPLNITTTGNNPIVGVEFAVTMPMPMPIRPIPLYNTPRKRTIDEVYGEVNKLQQSFNWLVDKLGSRSETTEFRNIFNSYNTDTEFPCYPLDLTVPPSSPTKKSSSDDSNSIDQVEQVKTNLDTLVEAAETVSYAESVSSSSSNDTAEKDSGKSMDGYYLNRKQCHETFKKSGANIAKKCESILKLHVNLTEDTKLDRMQFRSFLFSAFEISNTFLLDRIFRVCDRNDDGIIDGEEFLRCLSTMMRGNLQELIAFCYEVYDVNGDRSLDRDELVMALECSIRPGRGIIDEDEVEDSIKEVVEIAMRKLDVNWDGAITFDDFESAVKADPLLLQVCGRCLPPAKFSRSIQTLFTLDYKTLTPVYIDNWAAVEMMQKSRKARQSGSRLRTTWSGSSRSRTNMMAFSHEYVKCEAGAGAAEMSSLDKKDVTVQFIKGTHCTNSTQQMRPTLVTQTKSNTATKTK